MTHNQIEIYQFLMDHNACREGIEYALTQPNWEAIWDNCPSHHWLLWILKRHNQNMTDEEYSAMYAAYWFAHKVPQEQRADLFRSRIPNPFRTAP